MDHLLKIFYKKYEMLKMLIANEYEDEKIIDVCQVGIVKGNHLKTQLTETNSKHDIN